MTPGYIPSWNGAPVRDCDGRSAGHVDEVIFDEHTRAPAWLCLVRDGARIAVPAADATSFAGFVRLPYEATAIWAPAVPAASAAPATRVQSRPAALAA